MVCTLPSTRAVKKPSQRVLRPATVQAWFCGLCVPQALGWAKNASHRAKARSILASSPLGCGSVKSNHSGRTCSNAKAVRTQSALAVGNWACMPAHMARVRALLLTTLNRDSPWVGQPLTTWSLMRRACPCQRTVTNSSSCGVMATGVSKNGVCTTRSTSAWPGTLMRTLQRVSPLITRTATGTVWVCPACTTY